MNPYHCIMITSLSVHLDNSRLVRVRGIEKWLADHGGAQKGAEQGNTLSMGWATMKCQMRPLDTIRVNSQGRKVNGSTNTIGLSTWC